MFRSWEQLPQFAKFAEGHQLGELLRIETSGPHPYKRVKQIENTNESKAVCIHIQHVHVKFILTTGHHHTGGHFWMLNAHSQAAICDPSPVSSTSAYESPAPLTSGLRNTLELRHTTPKQHYSTTNLQKCIKYCMLQVNDHGPICFPRPFVSPRGLREVCHSNTMSGITPWPVTEIQGGPWQIAGHWGRIQRG